jgi:hypothetical protein
MSTIDKQRIAAVAALEALGFAYTPEQGWLPPKPPIPRLIGFLPARDPFQGAAVVAEADAMHSLLILRADRLAGCLESSEEATELELIADAVEAYARFTSRSRVVGYVRAPKRGPGLRPGPKR